MISYIELPQITQLICWVTALVEFVMGLYILVLNVKNTTNRHVSVLLFLFAINTYAQGQTITASLLSQIELPLLILAATTPAIQPGLLLIAVILLKPKWVEGRGVVFRRVMYAIISLPIILTIVDHFFQTNIWFTGYAGSHYSGGFVNLKLYTDGILGEFLRILYIYAIPGGTILPLIFIAIFDKEITRLTRKLSFTLLITQVVAVSVNFIIFFSTGTFYGVLLTSMIFAFGYSYAAFWQLISERRLQSGKLQVRLTALVLIVNVPLVVFISSYILTRTRALFLQSGLPQSDAAINSFSNFQTIVIIILIIGVFLLGLLTTLTIRQAMQPVDTLTKTALAITAGDLSRVAPIESEDEIGILSQSFNQMTEQLLELIGKLEKKVSERTSDLEKRSSQLQAAADVGRAAASILDISQLIQEVVGVIQDHFQLYYVGLFLLDEQKEWAYLRAGTGKAGREMLARGHRIRVGQGMIGWAIANAQPRVSGEVDEDVYRLSPSELPATRSEAAIPLRVRGDVIGAISVQDNKSDAFDEVSIISLQNMADLVSIAVEYARLYTDSRMALDTIRKAYSEASRKAWMESLQTSRFYHSEDSRLDQYDIFPQTENTMGDKTITIPIIVRDTIIGELTAYKSESDTTWQTEEKVLIQAVVDRLGAALESARLFEESQKRAAFERLTRQVTNQIRQSLDIDTVIRIAAAEFKRVLDLSEVDIRLGLKDETYVENTEQKPAGMQWDFKRKE
jgi:GAF domain-containing protein